MLRATAVGSAVALVLVGVGTAAAEFNARGSTGGAGLGAGTAHRRHGPTPLPARLSRLGGSRQVLIVQVPNMGDDHGTIQGWSKDSAGNWRQSIRTEQANIGLDGLELGTARTEGDLHTPEGTYSLTFAFGIYANPGSGLPYRQLDPDDYWVGDPSDPGTYNLFEDGHPPSAAWSTDQTEHLYNEWPAYRYAVNIDWNLPTGVYTASDGEQIASHPANSTAGYAIFLHTFGVTGPNGYTLGCVAIDPGLLAHILRWLDPSKRPKIVIGTTANITRQ
jgi:L,D-peptidoglycan transpeptidase YkuD (ErfK/YbiS/YcfS/YnhG family)